MAEVAVSMVAAARVPVPALVVPVPVRVAEDEIFDFRFMIADFL